MARESKSSMASGTTATASCHSATTSADESEYPSDVNADAGAGALRRSLLGDEEDDAVESRGRSADVVTLGGSRRGSKTVRGSPEEFEREPLLGNEGDEQRGGQGSAQHTGPYHLS